MPVGLVSAENHVIIANAQASCCSKPLPLSNYLPAALKRMARGRMAIKRGGKYEWLTWNDVAADVRRLAAALVAIGIEPGGRVAHVSENRYEWIVVDLAIQLARAIHVPIHPTLAGPQIAWQLRHCGCKVAFLSGTHQAEKLAAAAAELPAGVRYFSFDAGGGQIGGGRVESFAELCKRGALPKESGWSSWPATNRRQTRWLRCSIPRARPGSPKVSCSRRATWPATPARRSRHSAMSRTKCG